MTRATLAARSVLAVAIGLPVAAMLIATFAPVVGGRIGGPPAGSALCNADSGLCLAVAADGAPALAPCIGGEDQLWRRLTGGAGAEGYAAADGSGCLAGIQWYFGGGRGGAVLVAACGRNDMQRWRPG